MTWETIQCAELVCDGCGETYEMDGFVPHFEPGRIIVADDWYIGDKDYCDACRETVAHEHTWDGGQCDVCRAGDEC